MTIRAGTLRQARGLSRALALAAGVLATLAACAGPAEDRAISTIRTEIGRTETGGSPPMASAQTLDLPNGSRLPASIWDPAEDPPRGVILALHGFNDHAGAYEVTGPALAARGWMVVAPDQKSFGRTDNRGVWPGTDRLIDDARSALALLAGRSPSLPLILMGESMGGAVAIAALTGPEPEAREAAARVSGLVLSAPAVWARETMPWHYRAAMWLTSRLTPWLRLSGRGLERYPSDNIAMLRRLSVDPLWIRASRADAIAGVSDMMDIAYRRADQISVPSLMLHGLNDQIIPSGPTREVAARMAAKGPDHRLAIYPQGWHMLTRDIDGPLVIADIAAWLADHDAPLPSGADELETVFLSGALKSYDERGDHQTPWTRWNAMAEEARAALEADRERTGASAEVTSAPTPGG